MSDPLIRVLIADDHALVRKSLLAMLEKEPDIEVVATAENGEEAVKQAEEVKPDIIVMDVSMPKLDGIRAAGKIKAKALEITPRIIMLSMHHSAALMEQAKENGALGYIVKQQANTDLIPAIRAVFDEEYLF